MPPKTQNVWLDIAIGDQKEHDTKLEAYNRAVEFFTKAGTVQPGFHSPAGSTYGFTAKSFEEMTLEERENVKEIYSSDPNWSKKGEFGCSKPDSIIAGRVTIELFSDVPKASANFQALCTGEKGKSKFKKEKDLHYKGCPMHRIITGYMAQGGDVINGDGSGGESIYGGKFNDEQAGLKRKFVRGTVGMANSGKNSNTSGFFFVFNETQAAKVNGKYVAFGQIIDGLEVLDKLEAVGTPEGNTKLPVFIHDCGLA